MIFTRNIHETVAVVAVAAAVVLIALQPVAVLPLVQRVGCMIACLVLTKQAAMVVLEMPYTGRVVCLVFHLGTALVCLNYLNKDNRFFPPSKGPTCSQKQGFLVMPKTSAVFRIDRTFPP